MEPHTRRLNRLGLEIWFGRILWGYWPIHIKGWAMTIGGVLLTLAGVWLARLALLAIGFSHQVDWAYIVLLIGVVWQLWLSERHSPDTR